MAQHIPGNLGIISAGNGDIHGQNISWQLELEPEERKEIAVTFMSTEEAGTTIEVPAATLRIFDRVNNQWLEFPYSSVASAHPGDVDSDNVIGDFELLDYIDQWAAGQVGDFDLLDCIDLWAAGHYYWDAASSEFKPGYGL